MQIDEGAAVTAKTHLSRAGDDAERFMRGAVVVVVGINAAAPTAAPAIAGEQPLTGRSRAGAALEHLPIHDERQTRVVGHEPSSSNQCCSINGVVSPLI